MGKGLAGRIKFSAGAGRGRIKGGKSGARVVGLKELHKSFDRIISRSDGFLTRQAHLAAQRIGEHANRDVPIDEGNLKSSIKVTKGNKSAVVEVGAGYAGYVESGTSRMRKQPYFFKHVDPSIKIMMRNLSRNITL